MQRCLAGDGYLDRSKVQEAVPYGTTIEPPNAHEGAGAAGERGGDDSHRAPSGVTSSTVDPEPGQGRRGGGGSQPR